MTEKLSHRLLLPAAARSAGMALPANALWDFESEGDGGRWRRYSSACADGIGAEDVDESR